MGLRVGWGFRLQNLVPHRRADVTGFLPGSNSPCNCYSISGSNSPPLISRCPWSWRLAPSYMQMLQHDML